MITRARAFKGLLLAVMVTTFLGCNWMFGPRPVPSPGPPPPPDPSHIIPQVIHATDWTGSLFLIAIAVCIFAALNGVKWGWAGVIAAGAGLFVKSALSNVWVWTWSGVILVIGVGIAIVSILVKRGCIKDLIKGAEDLKWGLSKVKRDAINGILAGAQSKSTQNMVKKVKAKLALPEEQPEQEESLTVSAQDLEDSTNDAEK